MMMKNRNSSATSKRKRAAPTSPTATMAVEDDRAGAVLLEDHDRAAGASSSSSSAWTEAMHSSFLNRMEAAFVHDILFCSGLPASAQGHHAAANHQQQQQQHRQLVMSPPTTSTARLDRYVPDFAESTHDGHGGDHAPSAPATKRRRAPVGWELVRRIGRCNGSQDISTLSHGGKAGSSTTTRPDHPLGGPPKDSTDNDGGDVDQVVPLFHMPQTSGGGSTSTGTGQGQQGAEPTSPLKGPPTVLAS